MALTSKASDAPRQSSLPIAIARLTASDPLLRIGAESGERLFAAFWRFPPTVGPIVVEHPTTGTLCYQRAGTPRISRVADGKRVRKRPRIGSVTFAPMGVPATWESDRPCEQVHVYVDSHVLEQFAAEHLEASATPQIDDFFAATDPWLDGYFQMLIGEYDLLRERGGRSDTLLLDQTECLLVRHLVRWHSTASRGERGELDRQRRVTALHPVLTRRVQEYVEENLADELSLRALADLAHMSADHFLRAFRAATGNTPYRYVLEQRLRKASQLLSESDEAIARIAGRCGFRSVSHFSATFHAHTGLTPSRFRRQHSTN